MKPEAIADLVEHLEQTVSLGKITPPVGTSEIYPSLVHFEKAVVQDHTETVEVADNAFQISTRSVFTEDWEPKPDQVADLQPQ